MPCVFCVAHVAKVSERGHVTAPPKVLAPETFLSKKKNYKLLKKVHFDTYGTLGFFIVLNTLSRNILSELVLLSKPLKSP